MTYIFIGADQAHAMKIRQKIPASQLIDDRSVPIRPGWMLAGLCLAGSAKAFGPPFEAFYPPETQPFGAGWSLARFLASSWAARIVLRSLPESRTADHRTLQAVFYAGWTILILGVIFTLFQLVLGLEWLALVLLIIGIMLATSLGLITWWRRKDHLGSLRYRSNQILHVIVLILSGTVIQIAFLCLFAALLIFRGIRRRLVDKPGDSPLHGEPVEEERFNRAGNPDEKDWVSV